MSAKPRPVPSPILEDAALDVLFRDARTHNAWVKQEVSDVLLKALYDLTKWGPTSANCSPMRVVFVKSPEAKEKLKPLLDKGNIDKTMGAPVTAVLAFTHRFYEELPRLFPHADARSWFVGNEDLIRQTAWRNGTLQAGYFIMAARALGLDCGPMSGFDKVGARDAFFAGQEDIEVNFLCNLGYGDASKLYPRSPRLPFEDVCAIV